MGAATTQPFIQTGPTVTIPTITTVSQSAAISPPRPRVPLIPGTMLVCNAGSDMIFIAQGPTAPTATPANGTPIPPNTQRVLLMLADTAFVAVVGLATGSTAFICPGQGE